MSASKDEIEKGVSHSLWFLGNAAGIFFGACLGMAVGPSFVPPLVAMIPAVIGVVGIAFNVGRQHELDRK